MPRPTRWPSTPRSSQNGRPAPPSVKPSPQYRTVAAVARELGIGAATLRKLVRHEPWTRLIGSRMFAAVAEFQAWVDRQRPPPRT
jgi:hypothetical protein